VWFFSARRFVGAMQRRGKMRKGHNRSGIGKQDLRVIQPGFEVPRLLSA
jgi:hypothetical protein